MWKLPSRRTIAGALGAASALAVGIAIGCSGESTDVHPEPGSAELVNGLTPEQARAPLAKIGPRTITVGEVAQELANKGAFLRARYNSPERRREFVDQMVRFELLAQEAHRRGYDRLPEVERTHKQMMIRRFLAERFEKAGPDAISDDDVRAYYDGHPGEFHAPEQVRASHILLRDRATAQRILREILAHPSDLALYRRFAEENNTDEATRDRFGDLGFFSRPNERTTTDPDIPEPVARAAFTIERLGGVYPEVVQSDRGFHILKLTGRRAAMGRTLEQAGPPIRNRLWRERREQAIEDLIAHLRAEADVEENLDLLSEVRLELPEGGSPTTTHPALEQIPGPPPDGDPQ